MEFINFLREEPVMIWFVLIALLVTVVPVASVLWHRIFRRNQAEVKKQTAPETKSTHFGFGFRQELVILFVVILWLLAAIIGIRSTFFE